MTRTKTKIPSVNAISAQTLRGFKTHYRRATAKGKDALRVLAGNLTCTIRDLNQIALEVEADTIEAMLPDNLIRLTWTIEEQFNQNHTEDIQSIDAEFDINGRILQVSLMDEQELANSLRNESGRKRRAGYRPDAGGIGHRKTIHRAVKAFGLTPDDYDFIKRFVYKAYRTMKENSWEF